MTIKELIKLLKKLPQEATIGYLDIENDRALEICNLDLINGGYNISEEPIQYIIS
jgi:hypothetical protein